jgi:Anaphase-promoting complex subunit 11 RING-H2 finger
MQHTQHQASSQAEYTQQFYTQSQQTYGEQQPQQIVSMAPSRDIGSMSCLHPTTVSVSNNIENPTMNKTDSHAVLMELFARDQDLVRQATESAKMKKATGGAVEQNQVSNQQQLNNGNQQSGKIGSQTKLTAVPTLNSWPHFSSISSLNNLGSMVGVKSITSMSGFDLANQGNLNKMGNLAQVKSMESMGKNDSYAFLEVFFGDRSMSNANLASGKDIQKGIKREREEDNDVGLSLDGDDPPPTPKPQLGLSSNPNITSASPAPLTTMDSLSDSGTLKRAYDDALAARGLMSVSRSSENLSDLALPAKIQRTLSQQYLRQHQAQAAQQQQFLNYNYAQTPATDAVGMTNPSTNQPSGSSSQQYPGQHPQQQQPAQGLSKYLPVVSPAAVMCTNSQDNSGEVKVPFTSICACCQSTGVDTQLRPCGHMFHEHCLKPSLQIPAGQPKCPIDNIPIQSALLAIPTDDVSILFNMKGFPPVI